MAALRCCDDLIGQLTMHVTGIGSLPFRDPAEAVAFVIRHVPDYPFVPQVPAFSPSEFMLNQLVFDHPEVTEDIAAGIASDRLLAALDTPVGDLRQHILPWSMFLSAARQGKFSKAHALKMQVCGPATFAMQFPSLGNDAAFLELITKRVQNFIEHVAEELSAFQKKVIIQIDEPRIELATREMRDALWECIVRVHESRASSMVHCCGRLENDHLLDCGADILSFDVYTFPPTTERIDGLRRHLEKGRRVVWGVVPTTRRPSLHELRMRANRWWSQLGGAKAVTNQSIISAACGLGFSKGFSPAKSFTICSELAETMSETAVSEV